MASFTAATASSKVQQEMLRQTFMRMDTDHDLTISLDELISAVQSDDVAHSMMRSMDSDNNGRIDFKEFCKGFEKAQALTGNFEEEEASPEELAAIRDKRAATTGNLLQDVFDFCDGDGSKLISPQETCMAMAYFLNRPVSFTEKFKITGFFDNCENREMDFAKFKAVMVPWLLSTGVVIKPPPKPLNQQIFKFVDADGSGTVSGVEALLGLKFLGRQILPEDRRRILSLPCFGEGGEVDLKGFESNVLPLIMHTDTHDGKKKTLTVVERGEAILKDDSLSAEDKIKQMAQLHEDAKKSDWLDQCGAYEKVFDGETELVTDFSS